MAQPVTTTTNYAEGDGWFAVMHDTTGLLTVAPDADLAVATAEFLGIDALPDWTVRLTHIDSQGWDTFIVTPFEPLSLVTD